MEEKYHQDQIKPIESIDNIFDPYKYFSKLTKNILGLIQIIFENTDGSTKSENQEGTEKHLSQVQDNWSQTQPSPIFYNKSKST